MRGCLLPPDMVNLGLAIKTSRNPSRLNVHFAVKEPAIIPSFTPNLDMSNGHFSFHHLLRFQSEMREFASLIADFAAEIVWGRFVFLLLWLKASRALVGCQREVRSNRG